MDVDEPDPTTTVAPRVLQPLSDEWFADLDESINAVTNAFEEMRLARFEPEDRKDVMDAERVLSNAQDELVDCLAALQNAKRKGSCWKRASEYGGHDKWSQSRPFFAKTLDRFKHDEAPRAPARSTTSMLNLESGEKVMKHLFTWWHPDGPDCVRGGKQIEPRMTEVDGRLFR